VAQLGFPVSILFIIVFSLFPEQSILVDEESLVVLEDKEFRDLIL